MAIDQIKRLGESKPARPVAPRPDRLCPTICSLIPATPTDGDRVEEPARASLQGVTALAPGAPAAVGIHGPGGTIPYPHTPTDERIDWFEAGSALNALT